jgi:hypothetical protein
MGRMRIPPREIPRNINPTGKRCITFEIPDDDEWEQIAWSTLYDQLALVWMNWKPTGDNTGSLLCQRWRHILRTWKHCDNTPSPIINTGVELPGMSDLVDVQMIDGKCTLVYRCCVGDPWIPAASMADVTNATTAPGPVNNQPSPGGGTASNCVKMYANALLPIPLTVNTGDTILINSASGSWWDGGEFGFGPLWRLPNGHQFVGGLDVGFTVITGSDPVVGANHMTIIAQIGATPTYVALPIGTPVTVPMVAANSQLFFQVNDSDISNNQGDCQVCYTITNNKTKRFTHTWNFSAAPGPWYAFPDGVSDAAWVLGQGFVVHNPPSGTGAGVLGVGMHNTHALVNAHISYSYRSDNDGGAHGIYGWNAGGAFTGTLIESHLTGGNGDPITYAADFAATIYDVSVNANQADPGTGIVYSVTITADGDDPF